MLMPVINVVQLFSLSPTTGPSKREHLSVTKISSKSNIDVWGQELTIEGRTVLKSGMFRPYSKILIEPEKTGLVETI